MKKSIKFCAFAMVLMMAIFFAGCDTGGGSGGARFTEGVFIGEADGMKGPLKAEVVFSRRAILNVRVIEHIDTLMFAVAPIERIPPQIVQHQSLDVEIVAGATITSLAILEAVEDAVRQANGDADRLWANSVQRQPSTEVVNADAEIVIVGAGAAGKVAAIFAAQRAPQGSRIVLLEKMPGIGGNAILSGGVVENPTLSSHFFPPTNAGFIARIEETLSRPAGNALGDYWLNQARADWARHQVVAPDRVFDSLAFYIINRGTPGSPINVTPGFETFARRHVAFNEWLNDGGLAWQRPTLSIAGFPWPNWSRPVQGRQGEGLFMFFDDYIRRNALQIDTKLETRATDLIVENGVVVGVTARHVHGTTYHFRSNQGIVLATGGFSANGEMVAQFVTPAVWPHVTASINTTNHSGSIGCGIRMGEAIGARLSGNMNNIQIIPSGDLRTGTLDTMVGHSGSGPFVNSEGRRFVNENLDRNSISQEIFGQTVHMKFIVSDSRNNRIVDGRTEFGDDVNTLLRRGQLYTANTLEALAAQMRVDPVIFRQTIENFNAAVALNYCAQFGRTIFPENADITTPPFFASPRAPAAHITFGGLSTTPDWQVIHDERNQPIEGLFAIGEVTTHTGGGLHVFADGRDLMERVIYPD